MADVFVRDCDECLKPYWNENNTRVCPDCE